MVEVLFGDLVRLLLALPADGVDQDVEAAEVPRDLVHHPPRVSNRQGVETERERIVPLRLQLRRERMSFLGVVTGNGDLRAHRRHALRDRCANSAVPARDEGDLAAEPEKLLRNHACSRSFRLFRVLLSRSKVSQE